MLKNMVAVVTGAVNGLGRQTLTHFYNEKAHVYGCDIRDDKDEFNNIFKGDVGFMKADVRSEEDMEEVFKRAKDKFGRIDILVNCAGYSAAYLTVTAGGVPFDLENFSRLIDVNICGQFNASRLAAREMSCNNAAEDGSRGVIILTSGFASRTARRGHVGIGACYGGVESMTLPLARELGSVGIRVATISPGVFLTPVTEHISKDVVEFLTRCQAFPHRLGSVNEYSDLALHIIQNKMINGEILSIDGGLVLPCN